VLSVVLGMAPAHVWAWGAEGHRIVGQVAEDLLDARTRAAVRALAGQESLADLATWMDEERPRLSHALPGSSAWHYDDIPVCGTPIVRCNHGDCASKALSHYREVLADRSADPAQRLLALRIVVHLVGDIHQPLHAADHDDRGGNDVQIAFSESRTGRPRKHEHSLHSAWDVDFVRDAVRRASVPEFSANLIAEHGREFNRIEAGSFDGWIAESHAVAARVAYGHLPGFACGLKPQGTLFLPREYRQEAVQIVRDRLAIAGIRLARLLQTTIGQP